MRKVTHECSHCGGWDEEVAQQDFLKLPGDSYAALSIRLKDKTERKYCEDCLAKALDSGILFANSVAGYQSEEGHEEAE